MESELLHTYSKVDPFDVLILCVRVAVLTAVTLTVPIVLFPVSQWGRGAGRILTLLPELLSTSKPSACLGCVGQGLAVFSVSTHKTWLMPLVPAKLMMGNWDTMGLISWLGGVNSQAMVRNSRCLELSPRLSGPPVLTGWVQAPVGSSNLGLTPPLTPNGPPGGFPEVFPKRLSTEC